MQQTNSPAQSRTVPEILFLQGKLISQIVAYIWRWSDETSDNHKRKVAKSLKGCFDRTHSRITGPSRITGYNASLEESDERQSYTLETLFTVDVRSYVEGKKQDQYGNTFTDDQKHAAELLRAVFTDERIKNPELYLSPIFERDSVSMPEESDSETQPKPVYEFFVNPNSFIGTLEDPDMERRLSFKYMVSFPPRPQLSEATVTGKYLEEWIEDQDTKKYRPDNPYIPVTTT